MSVRWHGTIWIIYQRGFNWKNKSQPPNQKINPFIVEWFSKDVYDFAVVQRYACFFVLLSRICHTQRYFCKCCMFNVWHTICCSSSWSHKICEYTSIFLISPRTARSISATAGKLEWCLSTWEGMSIPSGLRHCLGLLVHVKGECQKNSSSWDENEPFNWLAGFVIW